MKNSVLLRSDRDTCCIHSDIAFLEKTQYETIVNDYFDTVRKNGEVGDIIKKCPISKMLGNAAAQFP